MKTTPPVNTTTSQVITTPPVNTATSQMKTTPPVNTATSQMKTTPPVNTAPSQMKTTPPVNTANSQMKTTPPVNTASSQMKTTPPVNTATSQVITTPPVNTATSQMKTTPPVNTANSQMKTTPPVNTAPSQMKTTPPVNTATSQVITTPPVNTATSQMKTTPHVNTATSQMKTTPPVNTAPSQMKTTPPVNTATSQVITTPPVNTATSQMKTTPPVNTATSQMKTTPPVNTATSQVKTTPPVNTATSQVKTTPPVNTATSQVKTTTPVNTATSQVKTTPPVNVAAKKEEAIHFLTMPSDPIPLAKGERLTVCGEGVEETNLQTLEGNNWVDDQIVNAYLKLLSRQSTDSWCPGEKRMFSFPSYAATQWKAGNFTTYRFSKVDFTMYDLIMVPRCHNSHWVLLVAQPKTKTVNVYDSLGGDNKVFYELFRKFMSVRSNVMSDGMDQWHFSSTTQNRQTDGTSCGIFTLMKAECLVNNLPALTLGQSHVAFFRNYVRGRLLASGDRHTYLCNALQCIDPRGQLKWLNCDVCGRWVHEKCIGTGLDTEGFRCDICNVQYS
ncbi:hypothetical protein DPMN_052247 [Dreissena polymorpha]|uniref:Ubiquitin-like protease family profile domain-containing protein n=2 Tax=Dreissena polymorpha TaxID=45954 RepID=A0A9D4HPP5_DREPO|nr:hypothetical protein DPMN_052247 [Dreissena polymorpha]